MTKRMLVDATHAEETRVVVLDGHRLEEFDFETEAKKQLKGNIYLAKVTRVEPSLQAAFVEYGGNRHGFLAFSEIHPDYYRIPVADREALIAEQEARAAEAEAEAEPEPRPRRRRDRRPARRESEAGPSEPVALADAETAVSTAVEPETFGEMVDTGAGDGPIALLPPPEAQHGDDPTPADAEPGSEDGAGADLPAPRDNRPRYGNGGGNGAEAPIDDAVETVGGDDVEEAGERRQRQIRNYRNYKIQEVIKRRQIMLVQVTKEERGTKGAALTTYLSLAGRYCVLMPNTPRGGGISRKIANPKDRKKMKAILDELDTPDGMAVILRTAGLERTRTEIKRDLDYLLRLWDSIRETTLQSTAPCLIHEEANLIKRAIRDLYSKDIDDIEVAGEDGYRVAKDFMRMLMPSHAKKVQPYQDGGVPLFHRYQVESQIDAMHSPVVQLRSGGYIVINPTEALVSIDVNSGRATRERNIEETAYKTNLEAADEVARQLRLRDLAGLIVIDFIDMEDDRHNQAVERRLKEAMRQDRARIQIGRISAFGLLELSRQRLRPSLLETHFETCAHCGGLGLTRTTGSAALSVLRAIEEEGIKKRASEITVHVTTALALYILNQKRDALAAIEQRYGLRVLLERDDTLIAPAHRLERTRARLSADEQAGVPRIDTVRLMAETDAALAREAEDEDEAETEVETEAEQGPVLTHESGESRNGAGGRRRRRRRGRRHGDEGGRGEAGVVAERALPEPAPGSAEAFGFDPRETDAAGEAPAEDAAAFAPPARSEAEDEARHRRRGRRGGRRRGHREEGHGFAQEPTGEDRGAAMPDDGGTTIAAEAHVPAPETGSDAAPTPIAEAEAPPAAEVPALAPETPDEPMAAVAAMPDEPVAAEPAPKPRKRTPRKKKAETAAEPIAEAPPPAEAMVEAAVHPLPAIAPVEPAPRDGGPAAPETPPAPAADEADQAAADQAASATQVINQPPDTPRRGWWRRLAGG